MPVGCFLIPYKRDPRALPSRYCAILDFQAQLEADGGRFAYRECLGSTAVVKVRASDPVLDLIAAAPGVTRIPARFTDLSQPLADLTAGERTAIRNKLIALGYTATEIDTAIGSTIGAWRTKTMKDVFRFALTRRLTPRYDSGTDAIILDGAPMACGTVEAIDAEAP